MFEEKKLARGFGPGLEARGPKSQKLSTLYLCRRKTISTIFELWLKIYPLSSKFLTKTSNKNSNHKKSRKENFKKG
jgi:hypothetical protein